MVSSHSGKMPVFKVGGSVSTQDRRKEKNCEYESEFARMINIEQVEAMDDKYKDDEHFDSNLPNVCLGGQHRIRLDLQVQARRIFFHNHNSTTSTIGSDTMELKILYKKLDNH